MSVPPGTEMFQFPGFASPAYVFSWRYPKGVGCPIRIPTDQRLLAAPRGFSQRATSFIASWCQGIHRMPFLRSRSKHPPCTEAIHTRNTHTHPIPTLGNQASTHTPAQIDPRRQARRPRPIARTKPRHSAHIKVRRPIRATMRPLTWTRPRKTRQTNPLASERIAAARDSPQHGDQSGQTVVPRHAQKRTRT